MTHSVPSGRSSDLASGRKADDVVAVLPPRKGRTIVEVLAVNAIMAGCKAEYMPLLIAAIEGVSDATYPLELMQVTTNPMTPFRSEEHTSELQSLMRIPSAVFCLKQKTHNTT